MIRQQGVALVMVLWILMLLTIMAASFSLTIRRETAVISHTRENAQATAIAEAGIAVAQLNLLHKDKNKRWRSDGSLYEVEFADAKIRLQIQSESGKIDINKAERKLLKGLFSQTTVEPELHTSLVGAIIDWRDSNDNKQINGAEKKEYSTQGLAYEPRNKAFQSINEVRMVLGVTPEIYQQLEPMITIYSGQKNTDVKTAGREVLLAATGVDSTMVDDYLALRLEHNRNNLPTPPFPIKQTQPQKNSNKEIYTIISEVRLKTGASTRLKVIAQKRFKKNQQPFQLLSWGRDYALKNSLFTTAMDSLLINQNVTTKF